MSNNYKIQSLDGLQNVYSSWTRSCNTYFDKETTFSSLKISFSSSVSHETIN